MAGKDLDSGESEDIGQPTALMDALDKHVSVYETKQSNDTSSPAGRTVTHERWRNASGIIREQWFLIALGILIAIASQVQIPPSHQELKKQIISYLCISIIFFVTGSILDTKDLIQNYNRWRSHLFVQTQCYLMTSATVFGVVSATATNRHFMDAGLLVGLIFMSCVATTISSNVVMTRQAHGNQAMTVVQTTVGNFIGVFATPALVVMYTSVPTWYNAVVPSESGKFQAVYRRTLMQLGLSIYLPLVAGQVFRLLLPKMCKKIFIDWKMNKIGSVCLLVLLWSTYDQAFATHSFNAVKASNMIFIVFISVALWFLFFGVAFLASIMWLPREDVVAVCYCVPAKGIVMAVPLSTTIFGDLSLDLQSRIQIPIVIYQGLQLAFGSILISIFRNWVDAGHEAQESSQRHDGEVENG